MHQAQQQQPTPGTLLDGRYEVVQEINRGGSAVVYLAKDTKTKTDVALKVMNFERNTEQLHKMVKREVAFSTRVTHPNIVRLLDVFADNKRRQLVIVWELVQGPDLLELLNERGGALSEPEAAFFMAQLLRALLFMHDKGFCHRDIKPENCVVHRGTHQLKLIDFGLAKHLESAATLGIGTPEYMAPEMLLNPHQMGYLGATSKMSVSKDGGRESKQGYDAKKVDAWSVGVLLYVLVAAQYPFADPSGAGANSTMNVQRNLLAGRMQPLPSHISAQCQALIKSLLTVDPAARTGLESVWENAWLQQAAFSFASERGNEFVDLIRGGTNFGAERMSSGLLTSSGQLAGGPAPMDISSTRTATTDSNASSAMGRMPETPKAAAPAGESSGQHKGAQGLGERPSSFFGKLMHKFGCKD